MSLMPDIVSNRIDRLATYSASYDPTPVTKVVESMSEPVLLSGRLHPPEYAHELATRATYGTLSWMLAVLILVTSLALAVHLVNRPRGMGTAGRLLVGFGVISGLVGAMAGIVISGTARDDAAVEIRKGYVITASRIVLLGREGRVDIPSSAITAVRRGQDGSVAFNGQRGFPVLELKPGSRDQASLDMAAEGFASAFPPGPALRDGTKR